MSEKWSLSHKESRKTGPSIYFLLKKRGPIIYLAVLKKGAIRHAHPYYAKYTGSYPPPRAFKAWCRPVTKDKLFLGWHDRAMMLHVLKYLPLLTSNKSSTVKISFTMKSGQNDGGRNDKGGGGAKGLGGKQPGRKCLGGKTTRGGNGLGAKCLGFA